MPSNMLIVVGVHKGHIIASAEVGYAYVIDGAAYQCIETELGLIGVWINGASPPVEYQEANDLASLFEG